MKILSWNVNGIRSVYKKGFLEWLEESNADIVCLQEIKAFPDQLPFDLTYLTGYHPFFNAAIRKGYSGVAVYTKKPPLQVEKKLGVKRFDEEGRLLLLRYSNFTIINLYMPHGKHDQSDLGYKLNTYDYLLNYLKQSMEKGTILSGDFNIAHKEIDLARPRENRNNIMFTSGERQRLDRLAQLSFSDSFRKFNKDDGNYTWWPYGDARERNLGWRIDYIFTSKNLTPILKDAFILKKVEGSDHCPIGIEI